MYSRGACTKLTVFHFTKWQNWPLLFRAADIND